MARNQAENWRWRAYQDGGREDDRDLEARREASRPVCGPGNRAPRHGDGAARWRHPDAKEVPYKATRMAVTMSCPHCGHEWREPR